MNDFVHNMEDLFLIIRQSHETQGELTKAKDIAEQLASSISWLVVAASNEKDIQKRADILKEITVAERELITLRHRINKEETNE